MVVFHVSTFILQLQGSWGFFVEEGGRSQIAPTDAKGRMALRDAAEPLPQSAASGCHLPQGGRLSYFYRVAERPYSRRGPHKGKTTSNTDNSVKGVFTFSSMAKELW